MNTGSIHDSGALLLEPMSRIYIDGKHGLPPRNIPPVPPLNLDTSAVAPEAVTPVANGGESLVYMYIIYVCMLCDSDRCQFI